MTKPDRAKVTHHIPQVRTDRTQSQKITGAQRRAVAQEKARYAKRRRAGKARYE